MTVAHLINFAVLVAAVAYPMVRCNLLGEYVAPTFVCEEFKASKS